MSSTCPQQYAVPPGTAGNCRYKYALSASPSALASFGPYTAPGWTNEWWQSMNSGRYAMWIIGAWAPGNIASTIPGTADNWRAAPMPQWNAGDNVTAMIINVDRKNRSINLSVKAKEMAEETDAMKQMRTENAASAAGSTNLGALLRAKLDKSNSNPQQ